MRLTLIVLLDASVQTSEAESSNHSDWERIISEFNDQNEIKIRFENENVSVQRHQWNDDNRHFVQFQYVNSRFNLSEILSEKKKNQTPKRLACSLAVDDSKNNSGKNCC